MPVMRLPLRLPLLHCASVCLYTMPALNDSTFVPCADAGACLTSIIIVILISTCWLFVSFLSQLCREGLAGGMSNFKIKVGADIKDDIRRAEVRVFVCVVSTCAWERRKYARDESAMCACVSSTAFCKRGRVSRYLVLALWCP